MTTLMKRPSTRGIPSILSPSWFDPFDRLFRNDYLDLWDGDSVRTMPSINITDEKDNYKVELAAPGLKKEDFKIDVDRNLVTVSCEKETETNEPETKNKYAAREYNYYGFSRSFTIPDHADGSRITAKYDNGILHLSIPKKPEAQKSISKSIKVE
jgi:HSP20 family protein